MTTEGSGWRSQFVTMEEPDPDNRTYYDGAEEQSVSQLPMAILQLQRPSTAIMENRNLFKQFSRLMLGGRFQILSTEGAGLGQTRKRATSLKFSCYWQCLKVGHFKVSFNLQQYKTICISKLLNGKKFSALLFIIFSEAYKDCACIDKV